MIFRTELNIPKSDFSLSHSDAVLSMGSCFAVEMGEKLREHKFQVTLNPSGILFHPKAIENTLARIYTLQPYTQDEIFHFNERYFSWDHHSSFSKPKMEEALKGINQSLENANLALQTSKLFIITLGTAWVYTLKNADMVVANCHKVPSENFSKRLLSASEVRDSLHNIISMAKDANPNIHIMLTVSPVRHLKDGLVENNVSKSVLIQQVYEAVSKYENVMYFPSYELVLDDLRDYRFYKKDMLHPNETAVDYIWEKFSETYFSDNTIRQNKIVEKINSAVAHKPFNPKSLSHKKFLYDTLKLIETQETNFPKGAFKKEKEILENQNQ